MPNLRVFEVPKATVDGKPAPPVEWEDRITIAAEGDKAKQGAKIHLEEIGYEIRSINWGPGPNGKAAELVAYVTKKEG